MSDYSIVPPTGAFDGGEWFKENVLQQGRQGGLSAGGWTVRNEGYVQQTFLGASIRSFNLSAGFGDTSSTVSVELAEDEYNKSDGAKLGSGIDVYHNGEFDSFRPPACGSPVFFTFGKNRANVQQAFSKTFDDLYNYKTVSAPSFPEYTASRSGEGPNEGLDFALPEYHYVDLDRTTENEWYVQDQSKLWEDDNKDRGFNHLVFGGILQSYKEVKNAGGQTYSCNLVDPREILQNTIIIMNNYQGTTFNNKNLLNVYGFLEYDPSDDLKNYLENSKKSVSYLTKYINEAGGVYYDGIDSYIMQGQDGNVTSTTSAPGRGANTKMPTFWPVTGQGLSRRSPQGIPFYRISAALASMFEYYGAQPLEYVEAGFGGRINFRGYNYVVDFGGIPVDKIPQMYFMDFDQLDMLAFAQELCDVISHELFVSLLPIIDHPACEFLHDWNKEMQDQGRFGDIVAGIIRLDAIDKTSQPEYGAILEYLNDVENTLGVNVQNKDTGFELANVTTDKFVCGAQEVEMYYFENNRDRDELAFRRGDQGALDTLRSEQWLLETSLKQQILPFYGFLGDNKAVTIPKGWGAYQQILLDATNLTAFGVGNYYVATEMELRAALISYDRWKSFLLKYSENYIQDLDQYQATWAALGQADSGQINRALNGFQDLTGIDEGDPLNDSIINQFKNRTFGVSVPRCVWNSDRPYMGEDGYPASPCSPPYGYPLYYKRAQKIGIPEAGVNGLLNAKTRVLTNSINIQQNVDNNATFTSQERDEITRWTTETNKLINEFTKNWDKKDPSDKYSNPPYKRRNANPNYQSLVSARNFLKNNINQFKTVDAQLREEGKQILSDQKNVLADITNSPAIQLLPTIAKISAENSRKVYEFVKKVAEDNLGKKFLVKVPIACNLRYQPSIALYDNRSQNIAAGPFGFAPLPVNADTGEVDALDEQSFTIDIAAKSSTVAASDLFCHYTNVNINLANGAASPLGSENNKSATYRNGALKSSFNPITEVWEHNYKPEPQGGFFNYGIFDQNISSGPDLNTSTTFDQLPAATQAALCPKNVDSLVGDNGRISCYVRYDNSQFLNFANVPPNSMTQQTVDEYGNFIPDIIESLPNLRADQKLSFDARTERQDSQASSLLRPPSVAYVQCQLDEELYMPPKMDFGMVTIWAREYEIFLSQPQFELKRGFDDGGCPEYSYEEKRINPVFAVVDGGSDGAEARHTDFARYFDPLLNGNIINTYKQNLDPNHVYALITVPGRIQATVDQRWADGPLMAMNTADIKNIMTQDVVKIPDFAKPSFPERRPQVIDCNDVGLEFTFAHLTEAKRIQRQVLKGLAFNQGDFGIQWTQPSPVYPSMVALPLMSMERCYGPWLSSSPLNEEEPRVRYSNLGGKVEFVKDESLAPWNYAGYQLMNEAGKLQAEFSNSLLLISERGGFTYPAAPSGVALAKELRNAGPLVTNISTSISNQGVTTTVKLELYTSKFGKLQKQKELAISTVTRERQKITDRRNDAIRRGLGKGQANQDLLGGVMKNGGQALLDLTKKQSDFLDEQRSRPAEVAMKVLDATKAKLNTVPQSAFFDGVQSRDNLADSMAEGVRGITPAVPEGQNEQIAVNGPVAKKDGIPGRKRSSRAGAIERSRNRTQRDSKD